MRASKTRHRERWLRAPVLLPLLLVICLGCNQTRHFLTAELVGVWQTDDARYRTRTLTLESGYVLIGGISPIKVQVVENVKAAPQAGQTQYTVGLMNEDGTRDSLVLQYSPERG